MRVKLSVIGRRSSAWFEKIRSVCGFMGLASVLLLSSCARRPDPNTLIMMIEFSPTNLDPRVGLDAQSEDIDGLLFENLLTRDDRLNVKPGLADRWEIPEPTTYIFHLHGGVEFCDGRP